MAPTTFRCRGLRWGHVVMFYAKLYRGWERTLFTDESLSMCLSSIVCWYRYIDNIFAVWNSSKLDLLRFMERLYSNTYNLKLQCDSRSISFLDLDIFKQEAGTVGTSLYSKPMPQNTVLQASSVHLKPFIKTIPYSQYLIIRQNCSNQENFKKESNLLKLRLLERDYTKTTLRKAYNKTCQKNRQELLFGNQTNKQLDTVRIVTTYSSNHYMVKETVGKHWHLLTGDPILRKYINDYPQITYKKCRSLKGRLVQTKGVIYIVFVNVDHTLERRLGIFGKESMTIFTTLEKIYYTLQLADM